MKKVFVQGPMTYANVVEDAEVVYDLSKADLVIFTGEADVYPGLYSETTHQATSYDSQRDVRDKTLYEKAKELGIPMLGICRGAQFLTVMSGGKLIQHVEGHAISNTHPITLVDPEMIDFDKETIPMTSTHHQMMYPYVLAEDKYSILAYSTDMLSNFHWKDEDTQYDMFEREEPEIIHYTKTNCLCIQGHPERMTNNEEVMSVIRGMIDTYLVEKNVDKIHSGYKSKNYWLAMMEEIDDEEEDDELVQKQVEGTVSEKLSF